MGEKKWKDIYRHYSGELEHHIENQMHRKNEHHEGIEGKVQEWWEHHDRANRTPTNEWSDEIHQSWEKNKDLSSRCWLFLLRKDQLIEVFFVYNVDIVYPKQIQLLNQHL